MTFLFSFPVLWLVLGHLTDGSPLQQQCSTPPVMEGDTAVLTYYLRHDINDITGHVFAVLRRDKRQGDDIMTCERNSPWNCTFDDLVDQEKSKVVSHTLTVYIPNITKDFEDIYTLKVYVNDSMETISCELKVQAKPRPQKCFSPRVMEGNTGVMSFSVGKELAASDVLSAILMRVDNQEKILTCSRQSASVDSTCAIQNPRFQTDGFGQHGLTVLVPEVTRDSEGMYMFSILTTSTEHYEVYCYLRVKDVPSAARADQGPSTLIIAFIFMMLGVIIVCLVSLAFPQARTLPGRFLGMFGKINVFEESRQRLLRSQITESHKQKRWYIETLSKEAEEKLLQFKNNRPGSFLIRRSRNNKKNYILTVLLADGMHYLTIKPHGNGFKCPSTHDVFKTLCELVDHYKEHEIRVKNKIWGRLSKPIEEEPDGDWYFGQLAAGHAEKILQRNGNGSFLVTVSIIDEDGYDLSVNFNGELKRFGIIPDDENFAMLDTDKTTKTLSELVEYYQNNDLTFDEDMNYGRLGQPCKKEPEDVVKCESFSMIEREFSHCKRTRQGAYLISGKSQNDGTEGRIFELVVYFDGKPKRFPFRRERNGFLFPVTGMFFYSVYELLDFYRMHDIRVRHKVWGKLTQRFRKDPEEDWYFGPLRREDERELLLSASCVPGTFLVRECISDPDEFTLAVRLNGDIVHHRIVPGDTGFSVLNTNEAVLKGTLEELVQFYKDNELHLVDGTSCGKLTESCKKDPPEDWYFQSLSGREKALFKKKAQSGSFLITKHETMQRTCILLVFFQGKEKPFKVTSERNGLRFLTSGLFFYSWYELVAYYTEHDITAGDRQLGRLSKPFRKMCMREWFSAPLDQDEKLLLSGQNGAGSFLVRDGVSDPRNYVLAVNVGNKVEMFTITREDNRYGLLHAEQTFPTVQDLVDYYKTKPITVEGSRYGTLVKPIVK